MSVGEFEREGASGEGGGEPGAGLRRALLHRGRKFDLEMVAFRSRGGATLEREVVRHPGAVLIVPVLESGDLVLIRNRRISVDAALLEFPAGTLEPGEEPEACARRELIEETGYEGSVFTPLGWFYTSPGMSDERMHVFVATGLRETDAAPEEDETIRVEVAGVEAASAMIDRGEMVDAKSMLALLLAQRRGLVGGGGSAPGARAGRS